jgi:hypothetical protein
MVDIKKLTKDDVGKWVVYNPIVGASECGKIKSWNKEFIFVVYKCNKEWKRFKDFTGQATKPEDLSFLDIKEHVEFVAEVTGYQS